MNAIPRRRYKASSTAPALRSFTWFYIAWSLLPVLVAIRISFNGGKSRSSLQPMSMRWYTGDRTSSLLHDPALHTAMRNTIVLAVLCVAVATPLGVAIAIGLHRWRSRASTLSNGLMLVPIVTPEIVFGVSLFLVFTQMYQSVPSGLSRQLVGHVTFTMSFVVIIVRSRLSSVGTHYEEAARDLGATRIQAIRLILIPLLGPAIFSAVMVVFATSLDDFVISSFLSTGQATDTVPIKIYSSARGTSTPALNALATVMLLLSLAAVGLAAWAMSRSARRQGTADHTMSALAGLG